jgi:type IV pilus biogenesis protein CpaD/CtpE
MEVPMRVVMLVLAFALTVGCKQTSRMPEVSADGSADVTASAESSSDAPVESAPESAMESAEGTVEAGAPVEVTVVPPGGSVVVEAPAVVSTGLAKEGD